MVSLHLYHSIHFQTFLKNEEIFPREVSLDDDPLPDDLLDTNLACVDLQTHSYSDQTLGAFSNFPKNIGGVNSCPISCRSEVQLPHPRPQLSQMDTEHQLRAKTKFRSYMLYLLLVDLDDSMDPFVSTILLILAVFTLILSSVTMSSSSQTTRVTVFLI